MADIKPYIVKEGSNWIVQNNSPLEDDILNFFYRSWNVKRAGFFPGPQPISIERKHFPLLVKKPYAVCEKSDGVRYCLVCKMFGKSKVCCLINRALKIIIVSVSLSKNNYLGCVMDGELVNDNEYIIYDCVFLNGESCMKSDLAIRLEKVQRFVYGVIKTKNDSLNIRTKVFYPLEKFLDFQKDVLPKLNYKTDGYIFTPVLEPLTVGTHETMFKWKPKDKNTIDFQFKMYNDKWYMFIQERGRLLYESEIPLETELDIKEDSIVECKYDEEIGWIPQLIRNDKTHPNNRRTYYNTLKNISEDITISEFHQLFV